jgi:hypothetical protein
MQPNKEVERVGNDPRQHAEETYLIKIKAWKSYYLNEIISAPPSDHEIRTHNTKNQRKPEHVHPSMTSMFVHQLPRKLV